MQKSQQSQRGNPRGVSNLMEHEVTVCDTCGVQGRECELAICHKCPDGAQHIYCMRVKLDKVPNGEWACEECFLGEETNKLVLDKVIEPAKRTKRHLSEGSINPKSTKALKSKMRSSCARKSGENCASSTIRLSTEECEVPLEAQLVKKARTIETNDVPPRSSKPCNHSPLCEENKAEEKIKSANMIVYSLPQRSTKSQKKAKVPHASGDIEYVGRSTKSNKKQRNPVTSVISPKPFNSSNHYLLQRETPLKELGKAKLQSAGNDSSSKQCSSGIKEKEKLPNVTEGSRSKSMKPDIIRRFEKGMIARNPDNFFRFRVVYHESDAVENAGKIDQTLQNHNSHIEPNCQNGKKEEESQQADYPTKAATDISVNKSCTGSTSDESSFFRDLARVETTFISQSFVFPRFHCSWLGKFQICSNLGIARTFDGIQAHLSSHAVSLVQEAMGKLPEIIILEELTRLRIWPSQFVGSQVTEENIGLYFFAKDIDSYETQYTGLMNHIVTNDLALKANLDGAELFIFPSSILPEKSQRWNQMPFFWGLFREKKVNSSAKTPVSKSLKSENRDNLKSFTLDHNAYPQEAQEGDDLAQETELSEIALMVKDWK